MRFLIHICLTSVVGPVIAVAAYLVFSWWQKGDLGDAGVSRTLLFAGLGGLCGLLFTFFLTLPFGALSAVVCYRMAIVRPRAVLAWVAACGLLGLLFGCFMGVWSSTPVLLCALIGGSIGVASGALLRKVWTYDWSRFR